ncbi:alpha/beta fold hydrolase [Piscinibacter sp. XHJ-5]|uniref:alpha/beta fold hydrolase n=1 Tax=Piscinibacter sp. XHJ-5 TaxID=3037797 RepID=UPI002452F410|nr:alpha/beta fold hydrolase [Piscinibacter sp. XHJ-5]
MLARLQQVTTLGLIAAALLWAAYFGARGEPVWAGTGALLLLFGYALVLALEFVLLWFVNRNDPTPRATAWQLFKAWWGEVHTAARVFCWRQPFRSNAEPDHLPAGTQRRGVVFVHGFVCNRGLWNPLMARLRALGVPFVAVNLEPVFGSIDRYADVIDAAVQKVRSATGSAPVVVAHSMGGLATRAWLAATQGDERVHRVITIGTPHRGTFLGRFGRTNNTRQMRLGSEWQQQLAAREPPQRFERFTCFYGHCDNVVFPASTATLPGADNRHIVGTAHVHMAHHDDVFREVLRWIGSESAGAVTRAEPGATAAR